MSVIKLETVEFENLPAEPIEVTVKHRLTSAPDVDGSYTIDSEEAIVNPDGEFDPEFFIEGLMFGTSYTVKVISNCDEDNFVTQVYVTPSFCPDVTGIVGTTGGGNIEDEYTS